MLFLEGLVVGTGPLDRIQAQIGGNPADPGPERPVDLEGLKPQVGPDKRFLGLVFRGLPLSHQTVAHIQHRSLIALDELAVGLRFTTPRPFYQRTV
jgi:hypothetical protein